MAIDMRHSKLTAEEAALLAGEMKKPNWQSKNEGIHERVSFEDSIWGFDLAGGSYYKTPLRVVGVKKGSRAEKAGIRLGDKLKRINDIDTSTLTIQEAHEIIIESGVHLKIAVTAPEDEEDAYYCYEDPTESGYDSEEERRRQLEEKMKKRVVHAKVSSYWSLQWPWVSKRRVIYRESNCFMVPSKYETQHKEKFPSQPALRVQDDIVQQKMMNAKELEEAGIQSNGKENNLTNSDVPNEDVNPAQNGKVENKLEYISQNRSSIHENGINENDKEYLNENFKVTSDLDENMYDDEVIDSKISAVNEASKIVEKISHDKVMEEFENERNKIKEISDFEEDISHDEATEDFENETNKIKETSDFEEDIEVTEEIEDKISIINDENSTMNDEDIISQEDEVIKGVLDDDGDMSTDDDRMLDSILSDGVDSRRYNGESER